VSDIPPARAAPVRQALVRLCFRLIERVAMQSGPITTHIPGVYSKDEWDALRAIWRAKVVREDK
jgi:hypothetical protein